MAIVEVGARIDDFGIQASESVFENIIVASTGFYKSLAFEYLQAFSAWPPFPPGCSAKETEERKKRKNSETKEAGRVIT